MDVLKKGENRESYQVDLENTVRCVYIGGCIDRCRYSRKRASVRPDLPYSKMTVRPSCSRVLTRGMASAPRFHKAQEEARQYVNQHNLERVFSQLLNSVVQAKPFNPFVFLIKQLAKHVPDEELQEQGIIIQKEDAT